MFITFDTDNKVLRKDLIKTAIVRSDMSPIPMTFEGEIRLEKGIDSAFSVGSLITVGVDEYKIIKSVIERVKNPQGNSINGVILVTAVISACAGLSEIRRDPIVRYDAMLSDIYRFSGAVVENITNDFSIPVFSCLTGDTPSFHISKIMQESGGVIYWSGGVVFSLLSDLLDNEVLMTLPTTTGSTIDSDFLISHTIPLFFSIDENGEIITGQGTTKRPMVFVAKKTQQQLNNMATVLVGRSVKKLPFTSKLEAGKLILTADNERLIINTAMHVYESGNDGRGANDYTKIWLSSIKGGLSDE